MRFGKLQILATHTIARESLGFADDLESLFCWFIEARHHDMKVGGQSTHACDFIVACSNESSEFRCQ